MPDYVLTAAPAAEVSANGVVSGLWKTNEWLPALFRWDAHTQGALKKILDCGDWQGDVGDVSCLYGLSNLTASRFFLLGMGKQSDWTASVFRKVLGHWAQKISAQKGLESLVFSPDDFSVPELSTAQKIRAVIEAIETAQYSFDRFKSEKSPESALKKIIFSGISNTDQSSAEKAISESRALTRGMALTRELGNLPANICTPTYLKKESEKIAARYGMGLTVLDREAMAELGMGAFLAVAQGSREPPQMIILDHRHGKPTQKPIVLIGKGVTFDAGGICLKPSSGLEGLKFDMLGAASVLGVLQAVGELGLPLNIIGILAASENLPDGAAVKPGDIVRTLSGQTVEIVNTGAEGRLLLCDALTYAERFEPSAVIDIATLTGACMVALGQHASGLWSNTPGLAQNLLKAGQEALDRAWEMPLWDDYQEQLKSPYADFSNVGGREAGAITAACFLSKFAKKFPWAHLDIAGVCENSEAPKGANGRPVPLLLRYLIQQSLESIEI